MYPSFPSFPDLPKLNNGLQFPSFPTIESPSPTSTQNKTLADTFSQMLSKVSTEVQEPNQLAKDMLSGKKEFDSAELMMQMSEAEQKLSLTVRVMNDLISGIKQLEGLQI